MVRLAGLRTGSSKNNYYGIGAKEEGTLRNHMVRPDGTMRHSVYFSILPEEWPGVERDLLAKLAAS